MFNFLEKYEESDLCMMMLVIEVWQIWYKDETNSFVIEYRVVLIEQLSNALRGHFML